MSLIQPYSKTLGNWILELEDLGTAGRNHLNPNRYNNDKSDYKCRVNGCSEDSHWLSLKGLCKDHKSHQHDLVLSLKQNSTTTDYKPTHVQIINSIFNWSSITGISVLELFESFSQSIIGEVQDVSIISGNVVIDSVTPQDLHELLNQRFDEIDEFLMERDIDESVEAECFGESIPITILFYTICALIVCEETNRGDRWFARYVLEDESLVRLLGGMMPLTYVASICFNWGFSVNNSLFNR